MSKLQPPLPALAEPAARRAAAETILRGYMAAKAQAWLCCEIPVMQAALLLALNELAVQGGRWDEESGKWLYPASELTT